jgi:hypothetical protein
MSYSFLKEKPEVSKVLQEWNWMLYVFMVQPFPDMIPLRAFLRLLLSLSAAWGKHSLWFDVPFHLLWRKMHHENFHMFICSCTYLCQQFPF